MTSSDRRRPLPALVFLAALTLLSGVVWYRVLHRDGSAAQTPSASPCSTATTATRSPETLPKPGAVAVLVLNSTDRNGLAAGTGKALAGDGFTIAGESNDDPSFGGHGSIAGVGEIRYGPQQRAAATLLSLYFPGAKLIQTESGRSAVVVALGRKFTKVAPRSTVQRALRARAEAARTTPPSPTSSASASSSSSCSR